MRLTFPITFLLALFISNLAFGAATVLFKDGSKEVGNSVWIEGNSVFLSKSNSEAEYSADEVLLDETRKINRIGKYADEARPDFKQGQSAGTGSNELVEQLMSVSSLDRQIDQFIRQFSSGAMSSVAANDELNDVYAQALAQFDPQKAKRRVRSYYRTHLDPQTMEAIVAWSKSPLGMKVREAEMSMSETTPEMAQQIMNNLEENPPPAQRLALIRDLDKAGKVTEFCQRLFTDAVSGATSAIPKGVANKIKNRKEMEKQINLKRAEIEPLLRKQVQAGLINAYKDLTDSELGDYVTFMRTEPAGKFTKATMGAMSELTKSMSASLIKNIVKAAKQRVEAQGR